MDKALGYLGLASRAGKLKLGAEDCAKELGRCQHGLLAAASDIGANTLRQAEAMCAGRDTVLLHTPYTKWELARAVGRGAPVALALVCDEGLARAFSAAVEMEREQEERV